jgi:5'-3' exonuclease
MRYLLRDPDEAVTHIAIAFDNPIRSFRNDLYDGYKTDEGVDPDLLAQFDAAEEATRALGMVVWPMDRYECDDALATGAARFLDRVEQVRILSPDKDLGQCIVDRRVVVVDRMRKTVLDQSGLRQKRGIAPESIPDFLALVGDAADGIPGISGFGEKSAAIVLDRFVHIEAIPADAADWKVPVRSADRLAATLRDHRTEALLYRKLATLVTDVPLAETFEELEYKGPGARYEAWRREAGLSEPEGA